IQQIESNIIQPVVMSQAVRLHPALVLFALLVMGTLFGVVGLVLAVPLVATFQVLVNELWVKRMDQVGEDPDPPDREGGRGGLPDRTGGMVKALRSRLPSGKSG
ncbi:MAG: AI-2E family transporter, partial [Actinomycetota bacterium]|nr:AI-2E family transporter [Actinomycetota bacterium]